MSYKQLSMMIALCWLLWTAQPVLAQIGGNLPLVHTVQPGETLSGIAMRYGINLSTLMALNPLVTPDWIYAGQALNLRESGTEDCPQTHIVKSGETLVGIALTYAVNLYDLVTLNNLDNPNWIYPGQHLQLPCTAGNSLAGTKRIVVDISEQRTYLYQGNTLVRTFAVSTGQPGYETALGSYTIQNKLPMAYAYTWGLQMPNWLGIYWVGNAQTGYLQNGFHALPIAADGSRLWEGYLGTPVSFGCIILSQTDSEVLYQWAEIGTEVHIRW